MNYELFKKAPFNLKDEDVLWVKNTLSSMTLEEKIGQLFFLIVYGPDEEMVAKITKQVKAGGVMCRSMATSDVVKTVTMLQSSSKIPMLVSANLEAGGNGISSDGTKVGSQMMVAATKDKKYAKALGEVCAKEALAVGANYSFAPIIDIDYNFRNPITNTRTFGSDDKLVREFANEYMLQCQGLGVACSAKHFPGDGRDERDQHLCTTVNDMSVEEWDATYGENYKLLINSGVKSIMIGHIMLPAYSRYLDKNIKDEDILPASLSKELLNGLLKEKLGFKGMVITDATTMGGFDAAMPRNLAVPGAIAAGCDMFLFSKNLDEDYGYMMQGYKDGIISDERLEDAVSKVLAFKASINLHKKNNIPSLEVAKNTLGNNVHMQYSKEVATKSITLVKEEKGVLPISPNKTKRVLIYDIESGENAIGYARTAGVYETIKPILEKEGFVVSQFIPKPGNEGKTVRFTEMTDNYDLIIYLCNLATKSNQTTVRIEWMNPMGVNVPRYAHSIPTIFVSTENPYHLLDVPMVKTYINTYGINNYTMQSLVDKLMGRENFEGVSPIDPFCGKWDTRR